MRRAINLPVLQRMFFFGVSPAYKNEQKSIQEMVSVNTDRWGSEQYPSDRCEIA